MWMGVGGEIETVITSQSNRTWIDWDFAWQQYNEFPSGVAGLSIKGGDGGGGNQVVVPPIKGCPLPAPLLKIFFKKFTFYSNIQD